VLRAAATGQCHDAQKLKAQKLKAQHSVGIKTALTFSNSASSAAPNASSSDCPISGRRYCTALVNWINATEAC
jgi:hypothetical protein